MQQDIQETQDTQSAAQPGDTQQSQARQEQESAVLLAQALLCLDDQEQMLALLEDLCTPRERQEMTQRLQVARMLDEKNSYTNIQQATGASATTVARVARCLNYGGGGYRQVLDRLKKN